MIAEKTNGKKWANKFREILAIIIWLYILIKLLVFDIDTYILRSILPEWEWALNLKLLALASALAILWMLLGHRRFFLTLIYVIFYPFIFILWKIPKLMWRKWTAVFILLPTLYNTIITLRSTFFLYTFASVSTAIILLSKSTVLLVPSMGYLIIFLSIILFRSLRTAHSSSLFSRLAKIVKQMLPKIQNGDLDEPVAQSKVADENAELGEVEDDKTQQTPVLPSLYLLHVGADYVIKKVDAATLDRKYNSLLVITLLNMLLQTTFIFSLENWALYKIDPNSFSSSTGLNFALFIAYSFAQIVTANLTTIQPVSLMATIIATAEVFSGLMILVVGVFSILTAARDSYREDLQTFSNSLHEIGFAIEERIQSIFSLSAVQLEISIAVDSADMINMLRKWRGLNELPTSENDSSSDAT